MSGEANLGNSQRESKQMDSSLCPHFPAETHQTDTHDAWRGTGCSQPSLCHHHTAKPRPYYTHSLRSPRVQTHNPSTSPFSPTPRIGWVESRPQGRSRLIRARKNQLSAAPESGADLQLPLKPSRVTASAVFPAGFMDATIKAPKPACGAFYGRSI